jgi:hypothetical protein
MTLKALNSLAFYHQNCSAAVFQLVATTSLVPTLRQRFIAVCIYGSIKEEYVSSKSLFFDYKSPSRLIHFECHCISTKPGLITCSSLSTETTSNICSAVKTNTWTKQHTLHSQHLH